MYQVLSVVGEIEITIRFKSRFAIVWYFVQRIDLGRTYFKNFRFYLLIS